MSFFKLLWQQFLAGDPVTVRLLGRPGQEARLALATVDPSLMLGLVTA
jgi:hypothetical protein